MSPEREEYEVIIVGGGPAGISAAVWCSDLGLSCTLLEKSDVVGGQLHNIHNPIGNYPGVEPVDGPRMLSAFSRSLERARFDLRASAKVESIDAEAMKVSLSDGCVFRAGAIIVATGTRRRRLDVPGELEYKGSGILESGAKDKASAVGMRVAIIGGGDAALENALILSRSAESVVLIHRRMSFSARDEFVNAVRALENVSFLPETTVTEIGGKERVEWVEVVGSSGESRRRSVDLVLVRIGFEPNNELLRGVVDLDRDGYVRIDDLCRTNRPGVFAIGDVACSVSPTISTAAGMGATAAKAVHAWLTNPKAI